MIRLSLSCLLAFSLALGVPDRPGARVLAQTPAPIVGTWVLSPLKSTAITGTFKERRLEAREGPDGLTITNVTVDADGRTSQWGFTTRGDGPVAVTGLPAIDTVVVRLEPTRDGHPFGGGSGLYTYKKAGQVVSSRSSRSPRTAAASPSSRFAPWPMDRRRPA